MDDDRPRKRIGRNDTGIAELPSPVLGTILGMVKCVRSRNAASIVCSEWHKLERSTRLELCLRGNVCDLHLLPSSFTAVERLDLSNCSPWGYSIFQSQPAGPELAAQWLRRAFPRVRDVRLYARDALDLEFLSLTWPELETVRLVRWHQRSSNLLGGGGSDLEILFRGCTRLVELDLSNYYCWTEDVTPAIQSGWAEHLRVLNLVKLSPDGFKAPEVSTIASCCPLLEELHLVAEFDPRFLDAVDDECLLHIANSCRQLKLLRLVDVTQFATLHGDPASDGYAAEEARLSVQGLSAALSSLPLLEQLTLLLGQNVRNCADAFCQLARHAKHIRCVQLSHFHGLCRRQGDGLAACSGLVTLSIKNCGDLCDHQVQLVALACSRLTTLSLKGCPQVSPLGLASCASILRGSLLSFHIECCRLLDTASVLAALSPLRARLQMLHLDCVWDSDKEEEKQCGNATVLVPWKALRELSVWISAGQVMSCLPEMGLEECPELGEVSIRVEGDCRLQAKPRSRQWGLSSLARYPALSRMRLDLSEAVGYALSAPGGKTDLSIWERFYLNGIHALHLSELDYSPPTDKEVNHRGVTLPGVGLLSQCSTLRKIFVHGTMNEHFFMMLLNIQNARDVQLREDYYPTPDNENSTELRIVSCRRFESFLAQRGSPD